MIANIRIVFILLPFLTLKLVSCIDSEIRLVISIVSRSLRISLLLLSIYFILMAVKPLLNSSTPGLMLILITLHVLAFISTDLLLVILLSDLILVWVILRFRFNHTSKYEVVSNTYLIYYIIIPSAPLLIFSFYDWFIRRSSSLCKNYLLDTNLEWENSYFKWFLLLSRLAKLPVFRFHYWLPKAHVQAPTVLSIILARLSLKVRIVVTAYLASTLNIILYESYLVIFILRIGITISTFIRSNASDSKVFLAYCSVSHITLVSLRVVIIIIIRFKRALLIGLRHCLSSPILFYLAGNIQYSLHSRNIYSSHGIKSTIRILTLLILLLLDLPFPPAFSFWREVRILSSMYSTLNLFVLILLLPIYILLRRYEYIYSNLKDYTCSNINRISLIVLTILVSRGLLV